MSTDVEVLAPTGDLDPVADTWLREQLDRRMEHVGDSGRRLILDLSGADAVGARTLDVLLEARASGAAIRLRAVPRTLRQLITARGLADILPETAR